MNDASSTAKPTMINTVQAVNLALHEAMGLDPNVIVLGEDVGDEQGGGIAGVTKGLSTKYGKSRVRATPISEQAIMGAAIGAAIVGMRPVAEIMLMNFTTVCMDMIVNHAAKLRFMSGGQTHVPLTIRTMTGAGFGTGGQHADYLEAWFAHTAGIKVVAPSSPADAYGLMLSCIFDDDPCLFIENMPAYWTPGIAPEAGVRVPLGKANILRAGRDITLGELQPHDPRVHRGRGQAREGEDRRRDHRPAHHSAIRCRDHPHLGGKDAACSDRARGGDAVRRRGGDRGPHP